jgi:hypothetical protein
MPDWIKRVKKERAQDLRPDETVLAASYFLGRGGTAGQISFGLARGVGTDVLGAPTGMADIAATAAGREAISRSKEGYNTFEGSMAATIRDDKGILAVTNRRLIFFGYSQGMLKTKILDVATDIDRVNVVGWSFKPGKMAAVVNLAFSDGSSIGIEIPRANKPAEFASTLAIPEMD